MLSGFLQSHFKACLFLLLLLWLPSTGAAQPTSVLGLEPGDRQLCNDDIGLILWGPDSVPTLSVGKSDVWDRRLPPSPRPVMTLQRMKELAFSENPDIRIFNGAEYYATYNSHDFPCPKPVGQIQFHLNFMKENGTFDVKQEEHGIRLHAQQGTRMLDLHLFVCATRNLIVLDGKGSGLEKGDFSIGLFRHQDTIIPGGVLHPTIGGGNSPHDFEQLPLPLAGGNSQDCFWVAQDFTPDSTFPGGFTSLLAGCVTGASATIRSVTGQTGLGTPMLAEKEGRISHAITKRFTPINEAPGSLSTAEFGPVNGPFTFLATITTTGDDPDPHSHAAQLLEEARSAGAAALWKEHDEFLRAYEAHPKARAWSQDGRLKIEETWGGVPYKVRGDGYYGDVPLCSVASTKFCFQDSSPWHADFHFNEVDATAQCIYRQYDLLDGYFRMVLNLLPMAQANAHQVYDCPGAMYPLAHYPLKADTVVHTHLTWEQSMEITALIAKPFWLRFLYTWDKDFLEKMAYPVLREGARFYAAYLTHEEDGLYHIIPTVPPEHRGITKGFQYNRDSLTAITLIRYHLRATAQAACLLGLDPDEARQWNEIAAHMPEYPQAETPEGPMFVDVAGGQPIEYNIPDPLAAVFWGDDIGLDSPQPQIDLTLRTLRLIRMWEPHRSYLRRVRARLGIPEPEGPLSVENILQSHTGVIRVFPAVEQDFVGGFENLGTQGAFIISANHTANGVEQISLKSLAGNPCVLANPWPGESAQIKADTEGVARLFSSENRLEFPTKAGETYRITRTPVNTGIPWPKVFEEDFSSGKTDRFEFMDPTAWKIVSDQKPAFLSMTRDSNYKPPVRSPENIAWIKDFAVADLVLDATVRSTQAEYGHRDICLLFGGQDDSHFYYVHLATKADEHANSIFLVNGEPRVSIASERNQGVHWDEGWHHVRVIRNSTSGEITVYFDDMTQPVMKANDKHFGKGKVGFGSFDDTADFARIVASEW